MGLRLALVDLKTGRAAAHVIGGDQHFAGVIDGHVAGASAGGVPGGKRMQFAVLDTKAGHSAGRFAVERIHLRCGEKIFVVAGEGDPGNLGQMGGDSGRGQFAGGRVPVVGENSVWRAGGYKDALAAGCGERRQ